VTVASFDRIIVIFNPQSTGDGPQLAQELHADLAQRLPDIPVRLFPTERAGYARTSPGRSRRPGIR
jgi:diacylglycerol kinase (ATP)